MIERVQSAGSGPLPKPLQQRARAKQRYQRVRYVGEKTLQRIGHRQTKANIRAAQAKKTKGTRGSICNGGKGGCVGGKGGGGDGVGVIVGGTNDGGGQGGFEGGSSCTRSASKDARVVKPMAKVEITQSSWFNVETLLRRLY